MAPHEGLVHPKEYDWRDSNVALINSELDHKVKHSSASTEPAWKTISTSKPALYIWRIEDFEVVAWPKDQYGKFYNGDSYIVLNGYKVGDDQIGWDIFFWLGDKTTQDEAGTAAYKTVELDELLDGKAVQHREIQSCPSDAFLALFPRMTIRSGGVRSGFTHVEEAAKPEIRTLLRVFKSATGGVMAVEVEATYKSLDDGDVFIFDLGDKIWVWQGRKCSPMEKAKAAQVVHDMTLAKHVDTEVVAQEESRSRRVVSLLGGDDAEGNTFECANPTAARARSNEKREKKKLYKLSDASGEITFTLDKDGKEVDKSRLDSNDVFIFDDGGRTIWVWEGQGASHTEKKRWLDVVQAYVRWLAKDNESVYQTPVCKVKQGCESKAFWKALEYDELARPPRRSLA